jgi:hypothetical protein
MRALVAAEWTAGMDPERSWRCPCAPAAQPAPLTCCWACLWSLHMPGHRLQRPPHRQAKARAFLLAGLVA